MIKIKQQNLFSLFSWLICQGFFPKIQMLILDFQLELFVKSWQNETKFPERYHPIRPMALECLWSPLIPLLLADCRRLPIESCDTKKRNDENILAVARQEAQESVSAGKTRNFHSCEINLDKLVLQRVHSRTHSKSISSSTGTCS